MSMLYEQMKRDIERVNAGKSAIEFFHKRADFYWRSLVELSGRDFDLEAFARKLEEAQD